MRPVKNVVISTNAVRRNLAFFVIIFLFCGFSPVSEIKNEKGNYFYKKGELGKARAEYKSALKSDPAQTVASYNLGNTFYKEDSYESSAQAYEKATQVEKDPLLKSKAYYNLGNSLYRQKQNEKAIEAYKNALRLNLRDQDAKYNLELLTKKNENKKEDQKKDDQPAKGGSASGGKKQDQKKDDQKKEDQKKDQQGGQGQQDQQNQGGGQGQEDKKEGEDPKEGEKKESESQGQGGGGGQVGQAGEETEEKPKTQEDIRAEQILGALENQEQQVLKLQGSKKNPRIQGRRMAEKDW